jgi:hypothetical protein
LWFRLKDILFLKGKQPSCCWIVFECVGHTCDACGPVLEYANGADVWVFTLLVPLKGYDRIA